MIREIPLCNQFISRSSTILRRFTARRILAGKNKRGARIKYFIDFNGRALTQPVAQNTSLSLPLRTSAASASCTISSTNFFYSFSVVRSCATEKSSSANGNGDRTLETISIKIFDRCEASRKLAATATKKENGAVAAAATATGATGATGDGGERVEKRSAGTR